MQLNDKSMVRGMCGQEKFHRFVVSVQCRVQFEEKKEKNVFLPFWTRSPNIIAAIKGIFNFCPFVRNEKKTDRGRMREKYADLRLLRDADSISLQVNEVATLHNIQTNYVDRVKPGEKEDGQIEEERERDRDGEKHVCCGA